MKLIKHVCEMCGCFEMYERERVIVCPWCGDGIMRRAPKRKRRSKKHV